MFNGMWRTHVSGPFMFSTEPLMFLTVTEKTMFNSQLEVFFRNAKFSCVFGFERLNVKRDERVLFCSSFSSKTLYPRASISLWCFNSFTRARLELSIIFAPIFWWSETRQHKNSFKMARIKSFFGSDLKTGGFIIGYVSLFANILYLILDVEAVLVSVLEHSNEKREIFGSFINSEINASSVAFPIILFALVASLYGVIASVLLICGVCSVRVQLHSWPMSPPSRLI